MAKFLDSNGLTKYTSLLQGELDALDARIEALENGGKYMPISGGTFTGNVTMGATARLNGILTPQNDTDAVNKKYADDITKNASLTTVSYDLPARWVTTSHGLRNITSIDVNLPAQHPVVIGIKGTITIPNYEPANFYGQGVCLYEGESTHIIAVATSTTVAYYAFTAEVALSEKNFIILVTPAGMLIESGTPSLVSIKVPPNSASVILNY